MFCRELQIVFIYDTLSVRKEEDDPKDAILYFHPDCIPEERRIAICGQLMGITHFLIDTFSAPKILTLDNGKFAMRKFGRQYVLVMMMIIIKNFMQVKEMQLQVFIEFEFVYNYGF